MKSSRLLLTVVIAALFASSAEAQGTEPPDTCSTVFNARNFTTEDQQIAIFSSLHDNYCDGASEKSSINFDSAAKIIYEGIPLGGNLSGGSSQEKVHNFCKSYDSEYRRNETHYKSTSILLADVVKAWSACEEQRTHGVLVKTDVKPTVFVLGISRTAVRPVAVNGVTYDHGLLSCTVPKTNSSPTRTVADANTVYALTETTWGVTCERIAKAAANPSDDAEYPQADIVVETDAAPPFSFTIPADTKHTHQFASDLQKEMDAIKTEIDGQEKRHYTIEWDDEVAITLNSASQSPPERLGKYDICQINSLVQQFVTNGTTTCKLSQDSSGWTLNGSILLQGAITCTARCGRIK